MANGNGDMRRALEACGMAVDIVVKNATEAAYAHAELGEGQRSLSVFSLERVWACLPAVVWFHGVRQ
jgi:hypothetical protein